MKKYKLALILATFGSSLFSQGMTITTERSRKPTPIEEGDKVLLSGGSFGVVIFDNLTTSGLLKLNGTTVKNVLHVDGSLLTQAAHLTTVEVFGEANFKNTIIAQSILIAGSLRAEKSTFKGALTLNGIKATFIGSDIASIKISPEPNCKGHQIIELKQKSIVDGSIVFEAGRGEVHCYPGSYVLGTVTGGKVVKKN